MEKEDIKNNDKIFTSILIIQEVGQRLLSELIGNNLITKEVKETFNKYLKFGDKFRNRWLKAIRNNYGEKFEEIHECDSDEIYDILKIIRDFNSIEQFDNAKKYLKSLIEVD